MDALPGWIATAPHWLQVAVLVFFALPSLLTVTGSLGSLAKSRADARATDGNTLTQGWNAISREKDAMIARLEARIAHLESELEDAQRDLMTGWGLHRGDYTLYRDTLQGWGESVAIQMIWLDQARRALESPDPLAALRSILQRWPDPRAVPKPVAQEDIPKLAPEEFPYAPERPALSPPPKAPP